MAIVLDLPASGGPTGSMVCRLVEYRLEPPFCAGPPRLLDLSEFEFDPCYAAKNIHRDLEPGARLIDLLNNAIEGREGTIRDTDQVTLLEHCEIGHGHLRQPDMSSSGTRAMLFHEQQARCIRPRTHRG